MCAYWPLVVLPQKPTGGLILERKRIYEDLYPETKHGGDRKSEKIKLRIPQLDLKSFVDDASKKTSTSSRVIHEEIQIAESLAPEVKETIRKHDIPKTDALKLARLEPEKQRVVIGILGNIKLLVRYPHQ